MFFPKNNWSNEKVFITIIIHSFNVISISTNILETKKISFGFSRIKSIINVDFSSTGWNNGCSFKTLNQSTWPNIVLTLDLTNNKLEKYFLSWRIVYVEAQSTRHAFTLNVVWCIKVWERSMYLFVRNKIEEFFHVYEERKIFLFFFYRPFMLITCCKTKWEEKKKVRKRK